MTQELKPCRFCASDSDNIDMFDISCPPGYADSGPRFAAFCNGCLTEGPSGASEEEAAKKWNRRASPWVGVEDGLPPDDREVFINFAEWNEPHKNMQWEVKKVGRYHKGIGSEWGVLDYSQQGDFLEATHWMPIPELPVKE